MPLVYAAIRSMAVSVKSGVSVGRVAATVLDRYERRTKSGSKMGVVMLSDQTGHFEAIVFQEGLQKYRDLLEPGRALVLVLQAGLEGDEVRARIQSAESLDEAAARHQKGMRIYLRTDEPIPSVESRLRERGSVEPRDLDAVRPALEPERDAAMALVGYHLAAGPLTAEALVMTAEGKEAGQGKVALLNRETAAGGPDRITATFRPPRLQPGEYELLLTVTDSQGASRTSATPFVVNAPGGAAAVVKAGGAGR